MLTTATMTIKQVADLTRLTSDTIRYYDKAGLLPHLKRSANGYRYFDQTDLNDLRTIQCFRDIGVSVEEIADIMQKDNDDVQADVKARQAAVALQRRRLEQQRDQIDLALLMIDIKNDHYNAVLSGHTHHTVAGQQAITDYVCQRANPLAVDAVRQQLGVLFDQQSRGEPLDSVRIDHIIEQIQPRFQDAVATVTQWVTNF